MDSNESTLFVRRGRRYIDAPVSAIMQRAAAIAWQGVQEKGPVLGSPKAAREFVIMKLTALEHEVFMVIYLDSRHRAIASEELFRGTIDGASVHPREVVKAALKNNACAVILAHNHPSGIPEPSQADEVITLRLRDALALVEIRLLDHLIVGGDKCASLAEKGLI